MSLDHLLVVAAVAFALVYAMFWSIGLFEHRPPRARAVWVAGSAALYIAAQLGGALLGAFGPDAWRWATHGAGGGFNVWPEVMTVACTVAAVRLVTFRRGPSRHRIAYAWLSWLLVVALTATVVKIAFGVKPPPGPFETIAVALFAWFLLLHHGNLAHLVRSLVAACRRIVLGRTS